MRLVHCTELPAQLTQVFPLSAGLLKTGHFLRVFPSEIRFISSYTLHLSVPAIAVAEDFQRLVQVCRGEVRPHP